MALSFSYYENRFIESASDTFTAADWLEVIGNEQHGGEAFALDSGQSTIAVQIPWRKARSFVTFALGWSYLKKYDGSDATKAIIRQNPVEHPRFPWLTAANVSLQGISPVGVANVGTKVAGIYSDSLSTAKYNQCIATVQFADRPWKFDNNTGAYSPFIESQRNTHFDLSPSVEIISAEGLSNLTIVHGAAAGTRVPAPIGTLMSKITYTLNWMWVPHEYISTTGYPLLTPTKILGCVGRVNSDTFFGFAPGTLLLQAPQFQAFRFPVATVNPTDFSYYGWNVRLPIQFFDPTRAVADAAYRGHQTVPIRRDLLWYGAVRENGMSKIFPEAAFADIFANSN